MICITIIYIIEDTNVLQISITNNITTYITTYNNTINTINTINTFAINIPLFLKLIMLETIWYINISYIIGINTGIIYLYLKNINI